VKKKIAPFKTIELGYNGAAGPTIQVQQASACAYFRKPSARIDSMHWHGWNFHRADGVP